MSIATEIKRLQDAKTTLKTKINEKNDSEHQITDELISDYGTFVDSIQTGGGDLSDCYVMTPLSNGPIAVAIKKIPILNLATSSMLNFFNGCTNLEEIPLIDTSNVANMQLTFASCTSLKTIPLLNTSKVTNMANMFGNCTSLEEVPLIDTSNVTNMNGMFISCRKLTKIPLIDTSKVTNMNQMFSDCQGLTSIPLIDTSSVLEMNTTFQKCYSLKTIPALDTSNVKYMATTFNQSGIETIPAINTENVISMNTAFSSCNYLTSLPKLNLKSVTNISNMFQNTTKITELGGFENLGQAYLTTSSANYANYTLNLSASPNITHDSLMNVINNLYDIKTAGVKSQQLILGDTNLAKLSDEEKQIATDKGWTIS
nr:MAG TPA: protein of unknown function DUF285 [Caudoviricetes sp.]